jgi:hypothetical protein
MCVTEPLEGRWGSKGNCASDNGRISKLLYEHLQDEAKSACSLNPFFRTRLDVRNLHILRRHKPTVLELSLDMYRPEDGRDRLVHAGDLQNSPTRSDYNKPMWNVM